MRHRKRSAALIKPSFLLELASHAVMGIALGLAFAFLVIHIAPLGMETLINHSPNPAATLLTFVATCATTFCIGATLTGLAISLIDDDAPGSK